MCERACSKMVWQEGEHGAERDYKAGAAVISGHRDSKGEPSAHTPYSTQNNHFISRGRIHSQHVGL